MKKWDAGNEPETWSWPPPIMKATDTSWHNVPHRNLSTLVSSESCTSNRIKYWLYCVFIFLCHRATSAETWLASTAWKRVDEADRKHTKTCSRASLGIDWSWGFGFFSFLEILIFDALACEARYERDQCRSQTKRHCSISAPLRNTRGSSRAAW